MSNFINYLKSTVSYITFGSGDELLFAFHGYGKSAESLKVLEPSLGEKYTVISVDIFFHGDSKWNENRKFTPKDLEKIILLLCEKYNYTAKFSALGYSIGTRYLQGILRQLPERINTLWVLAGDGLAGYSMYNFVTATLLGRGAFKAFISIPWPILFIFYLLKVTKLVDEGLYKFTYRKIDTKAKRQLLYHRWMSMADLPITNKKLAELCNKNNVRVNFIYGKHDRVTPYKAIIPLTKKLNNKNCQVIDEGHGLISNRLNEIITKM